MTNRRAAVYLWFGAFCALTLWSAPAAAQAARPVTNQPGATLLLPYFEVELDDVQGIDTLFSVNNASASAAVTKVTIWTDMSVPVLTFELYLTGYDVQTISLRSVLTGTVPWTADAGSDPSNTISRKGPLSQDINFPGSSGPCSADFSVRPAQLPAFYTAYLRAALTGAPSPFDANGRCLARNLGTPSVARGYVTVDSVTQCSTLFPSSAGYFTGFIPDSRNILWGDYHYVAPGQGVMYGEPLVQLVAGGGTGLTGQVIDTQLTTPGRYTFYGRYVGLPTGFSAADAREPLATNFAARFVAPKDFKTADKSRRRASLPASTDLLVWRDPKQEGVPFACNSLPAWYPLSQESVAIFDEQEQVEAIPASTPFPAASQRVTVAGSALPTTFASGWMFLNLNTTATGQLSGLDDDAAAQAWVSVVHRVQQGPNGGRYDAFSRATRLDSARDASHLVLVP